MKLLDVLKGKLKMNRRKQHFSLLRLFCASKNCCGKVACDIFYNFLTTESQSSVFKQVSLEASLALGNQVSAVLQG